jgi:hypothetical protein
LRTAAAARITDFYPGNRRLDACAAVTAIDPAWRFANTTGSTAAAAKPFLGRSGHVYRVAAVVSLSSNTNTTYPYSRFTQPTAAAARTAVLTVYWRGLTSTTSAATRARNYWRTDGAERRRIAVSARCVPRGASSTNPANAASTNDCNVSPRRNSGRPCTQTTRASTAANAPNRLKTDATPASTACDD